MNEPARSRNVRKRASRLAIAVALALFTPLTQPALGSGDGGGEGPVAADSNAAPSAAPSPDPSWQRMTLAGGELTLSYPPELGLAVTPDQLLTQSTIPACAEAFDYCLYLPAAASEGTNLSAAALRMTIRHDLTAELSCLLAQPAGWSELQPGVLRGAPASTSRFGGLGEGAAGSYSQGELRRLWSGESCYEFEARQVLTRYENYEPGAVMEFTAADQVELAAVFDAVMRSVTLPAGEAVEWPLAGRSQLEAFVRLDEPAVGAAVSSPLPLRGEAVGPWFFEASFPVELRSPAGELLAAGFVTADGEWMTTELVAFAGELAFEVAEPTEAVLVLRRDNPSDLREHDASVRIPLTLLP